jgi:hypothetical protein
MTINVLDGSSAQIEYRSQPAWSLAPNNALQRTRAARFAPSRSPLSFRTLGVF